jgi:hypothetical protein
MPGRLPWRLPTRSNIGTVVWSPSADADTHSVARVARITVLGVVGCVFLLLLNHQVRATGFAHRVRVPVSVKSHGARAVMKPSTFMKSIVPCEVSTFPVWQEKQQS